MHRLVLSAAGLLAVATVWLSAGTPEVLAPTRENPPSPPPTIVVSDDLVPARADEAPPPPGTLADLLQADARLAPAVERPVAAPPIAGADSPAPPSAAPAPAENSPPLAAGAAPFEPLAPAMDVPCDGRQPLPLPVPGEPRTGQFFQSFRQPLPRAALWNPPGPRRVGLQAGHWLTEQTPPELSRLQGGSSGGGKAEWEVNLDLAQRAKRLLEAAGVDVDVLPTTVPPRYRAHAFVAIHADGDVAGSLYGFKVARPGFSSIPEVDDRLVEELNGAYAAATGLPRDDAHISLRMLYYYAFNSRRYCHTVAPGVPQAIIETGFLTSARDRQVLLGNPEAAAKGIASGILGFLDR